METSGIVYLVGAGPGDPGLITARGLECIRMADVLVYDRLVSPALVVQSRPDAERIYVGKEPGCHGRKQSDINGLLAGRALEGKSVCRLKGGDPFVFGRGGEEADQLVALGVPYEVVPGITAGIAAPAYAGIPVTHRDFAGAVTLVTGHDGQRKRGPQVDWAHLGAGRETLLIYMGVEGLAEIAGRLITHGRDPATPVAVIRRGSQREQLTVTGTLSSIAGDTSQAGVTSPAMVVVGEIAGLRERLAWAEKRPLWGVRILVPVIHGLRPGLLEPLRRAGAEIWEWPVRPDTADLLLESLESGAIDAVLLPSAADADALLRLLEGPERLKGLTVAGLGHGATAAAELAGLTGVHTLASPAEFVALAAGALR